MDTLAHYTSELRRQEEMQMAWEILAKSFTTRAPRRFISGIALSSNQKNANDVSFEAEGGVALALPLPLLWKHEFHRPIGRVTAVKVRGDQVLFDAEVCNGGLQIADDVWLGLVRQDEHGVSVGSCNQQSEVGRAGHYWKWVLREISIAETGADPGARVLKVWERSDVLHVNRSRDTVHWETA